MNLQVFAEKRSAIEAAIGRLIRPSSDELRRLKSEIDELERIAFSVRQGPSRPVPIESPPPPEFPEPEPVPPLPESERYLRLKAEIPQQIIPLRHLKKHGRASKQQRKELQRLESEQQKFLERVRREDTPQEIFERRQNLIQLHQNHRKRVAAATEKWRIESALLQRRSEEALAKWRANKGAQADAVREHVIARLRLDLKRFEDGAIGVGTIHELPWRFIPPPEPGESGLSRMLTDIRNCSPTLKIDEARLRFSYGLEPAAIYIGIGEFTGYLAFTFSTTPKVLLECPMEGNAAYVFTREWKTLSRLSKTELLQSHRGDVQRIIHDSNRQWCDKVKQSLGLS
jgi:hypothetical protein